MPRERSFKVRYFQAARDRESLDQEGFHEHLVGIGGQGDKQHHIDGGTIQMVGYRRLPAARFNVPVWRGEMHRLRVHDRVAHGNDEGDIDDVRLEDGRYISECSYFLFVPSLKTLVYFSTMHSVSWTLFGKYANHFLPEDDRMLVIPLLNRRLVEQFQRMDDLRKVTLKVSRPNGWQNRPESLNAMIDMADRFGADQFTLEMTNDRGRRRLNSRLIQMIRGLFQRREDQRDRVVKLVVEGYASDDGEEKLVIDLLQETLFDDMKYDPGEIRNIRDYQRMAFQNLEESLTEHLDYIRATVNPVPDND